MSRKQDDWTPAKLLEVWGMRQFGRLPSAGPGKATGGGAGTDEAEQVCLYVEQTKGFAMARPVLSWVYYEMKPVHTFRVCAPGEVLTSELLARKGWLFCCNMPQAIIPRKVLGVFLDNLADRLREQPFVVYRDVEEDTGVGHQGNEMAGQINSLRDFQKSA